MKKIFKYAAIAAAVAICLGAGNAYAKDAIQATVTANGFTFVENGNPLSPGTYAVGTLKIFMIVTGYTWPENLGDVDLNLAVQEGPSGQPTKYGASGVPILLRQAGGDLSLSPGPATFNVMNVSWTGSSAINVMVPEAIRTDSAFNEDGTQLVASLQIEPTAPARHLDTVTTVKIYAMLVHPTTCLRTVAFISGPSLDANLTGETVGLTLRYRFTGPSSSPTFQFQGVVPSTILYDILVVNSCTDPQSFDLDIAVDSAFYLRPAGTGGNPVKSYVATNAAADQDALIDSFVELASAFSTDFGSAVPNGRILCIPNLTLGGMKTLYAQVDIGKYINTYTSLAALTPVGTVFNGFMSDVLEVNATSCSGNYHPMWEESGDTYTRINALTCTGGCT